MNTSHHSNITEILDVCTPDYIDDGIALIEDLRSIKFGTKPGLLSEITSLLFISKGWMDITVDGRVWRVKPGHMLFCIRGRHLSNPVFSSDCQGHALAMTMRYGQSLITVTGNIWNYLLHLNEQPVIELPVKLVHLLLSYLKVLKLEVMHTSNLYYNETISSVVRGMLCSLVNDLRESEGMSRLLISDIDRNFKGSAQALSLFHRFIDILTNEHCTERKIEHYADRLCVTPKYLSTVCRRVSRRTAHQWIANAIVNGIDHHLRYTDLSIKEIALIYGFPNLAFFSRYVKESLGATPSQIRKLAR